MSASAARAGANPGRRPSHSAAEIERLVVEALLQHQQRQEALGGEGVDGGAGAGREEDLAGAGELAGVQRLLRRAEGAGALVGGEQVRLGVQLVPLAAHPAPADAGHPLQELGPGQPDAGGARHLPSARGQHLPQQRRHRLEAVARPEDSRERLGEQVRDRGGREGRRAEHARRVKEDPQAMRRLRQHARLDGEGGARRQPAAQLGEAGTQLGPDVEQPGRGQRRPRQGRVEERRGDGDGDVAQIREPVAELAGSLADVEREPHVRDLDGEDLEREAGNELAILEAHRRAAPLEA